MERISESLSRTLENEVIDILDRHAILYRVFSRIKSPESLEKKLDSKKYSNGKKLQDLFGIRIVTYFKSDVNICDQIISAKYENISGSNSVDTHDIDEFGATRHNKIFRLPSKIKLDISEAVDFDIIDDTFEVQFRTFFSEGWHEIEHDLRYKVKDDWVPHKEQSRSLNGILATLETCDWAMEKMFDDLAYSHYKNENIPAMVRNKFRLRINNDPLDDKLLEIVQMDGLLKPILRFDRNRLIEAIGLFSYKINLDINTIIYLINHIEIKNSQIADLMPNGLNYVFSNINSANIVKIDDGKAFI